MAKLPFTIHPDAKFGRRVYLAPEPKKESWGKRMVWLGFLAGVAVASFIATPAPAAGSMAPEVRVIGAERPFDARPFDRLYELEKARKARAKQAEATAKAEQKKIEAARKAADKAYEKKLKEQRKPKKKK